MGVTVEKETEGGAEEGRGGGGREVVFGGGEGD